MRLRRITEHMRTHNWTAVFIDFVIVVLGVFVGVQVDSWWDNRSNARKERAYLLELKEDFAQIIQELEGDSREYEMIAVAMVALLQESHRDAPALSVAELNHNVGRLIYMVGTPIVADTYTNLTGSGDLALIRSQELKNALASFYARSDTVQLVSNTHEMQLVNIFQPYIMKNLDYIAIFDEHRRVPNIKETQAAARATLPAAFEESRILGVLSSPEFRNVVTIKWDISTDLLDTLGGALERAHAVDALLDQELAKPGLPSVE
jgi:hypothetical protein